MKIYFLEAPTVNVSIEHWNFKKFLKIIFPIFYKRFSEFIETEWSACSHLLNPSCTTPTCWPGSDFHPHKPIESSTLAHTAGIAGLQPTLSLPWLKAPTGSLGLHSWPQANLVLIPYKTRSVLIAILIKDPKFHFILNSMVRTHL